MNYEKDSKQGRPPFSGEFRFCKVGSTLRPEYRLSRPNVDGLRELVKVGEVDLQELVQSNYQNSFDAILDRFLESGDLPSVGASVENQDFLLDALDVMSDYSDFMEEARERYQLPPEMSFAEIREQLKNKLDEVNKTIKNGGIQNEKENQASQNVDPQEVEAPVS